MSRPHEADRAAERLKARDALDRVTPALAKFRMEIRDGDNALDRMKAEELLCDLLNDIEFARHDPAAMAALADASTAVPAAAAMIAYIKAGRISANVATVRSAVDQMAKVADGKQAKALLDLIIAASQSPKVPTYTEELLEELLAAGLTNGITAPQRKAIVSILSDPNFGKGKKVVAAPVVAAGPQPVVAASWASLPDPVPGFTFMRRKVHQNPLDRAVLEAGLPPSTSIDFFAPDGSIGLAHTSANRDKANFVWQSIKRWLAASGTSDPRLDNHRRSAWVFLLGHVHGFLPGVETIDKVSFASPWANDEVIHAKRVIEKGTDRLMEWQRCCADVELTHVNGRESDAIIRQARA